MGNYEQLKQSVADVIKSNGNQEITGAILQNALLTIISTVGNGATFAGIATPTTNPGTPDQNVFYLASEEGVYSNFGGVTIQKELYVLFNKNGKWNCESIGVPNKKKFYDLENNSNQLVFTNTIKTNKIISEIYLKEKFFDDYNWEDIKILQVRKNVDGGDGNNYYGIIIGDSNGTQSIYIRNNNGLPIIENKYCVAIINWQNAIDGIDYISNAVIFKEIAKNIYYSPYIYTYINFINKDDITNENGTDKNKVVSQYLLNLQGLKYNHFPVSDDSEECNKFIKEIYLANEFISAHNWNELYIFGTRKKYGSSEQYLIVLADDENATNSYAIHPISDNKCLMGTGNAYAVVNWDVFNDNTINFPKYKVNIERAKAKEYNPFISSYIDYNKGTNNETIDAMNEQTNTEFKNLLKTVGKTPMVTWIDDDGVYSGVEKIKPIFEELGISLTFALIPPLSNIAFSETTRAEYFSELQKKGHHCTAHPNHDGWYGEVDYSKIEPSLIEALTDLNKYHFLYSNYLIYPGYSDTYEPIRKIVKKWCKAAVTAGFNEELNHLGNSGKYRIKRCFIKFSSERTVTWYKTLIDKCYTDGDWLIFGTHSNDFDVSMNTSDESVNNIGNLKLVMQYVISKGINIYTLNDAYKRRKYLFEFNEINI